MSTIYTVKNESDAYLQTSSPRLLAVDLPANFTGYKSASVSQSSNVFQVNENGQSNLASITLTLYTQGGITGTPMFTVTSGTAILTDTLNDYSKVLNFTDMSTDTVEITVSIEDTSTFKPTGTEPNDIYSYVATISKVYDGVSGTDGARSSNGYVYYQLESATTPTAPTLSGYNFPNGVFTTISTNWNYTPPTYSVANNSKYWYARYFVTEDVYGGTQTVTISPVTQGYAFDGLVTFSSATSVGDGINTLSFGSGGTTEIDGGNITTGTISAERLSISSSDVGLGNVSNLSPSAMTDSGLTTGVTITAGGIEMGGTSKIYTSGKTYLGDPTAGFFMGYDSSVSTYAFDIGNSTNYLRWNGSTLSVAGSLTVGSTTLTEANTLNSNTTATDVGLGNVSNLSPAAMTDSGLTTGVTISGGGITMSGGGAIKTVLKDGILDTSEGVFLGYDSSLGGYGFAVGNSSDYVRYNPSTNTLEVRGVLNADDIVAGSLNASYIGTGVVSLADGAFGLGQGASWQGVDLQIYGESTINGQYGMGSINTSTTGYDAHGFAALAASAGSYGATIYNATGSGGTVRAYGFIAGAGNGGVFGRNWDGLNSNRTKVFVGTYGAAGLFTFNENKSDVHAPYAAFICGSPYAVAGQYRNSSTGVPITDGRLGGTTYAVYAQTGNMAPFTGSHDGLLDKTSNAVAGDILVDVFVYATRGVNDAICVNEVSSVANQKAVIGVLSMKAPEQHIPTVLSDDGFEYTNNSEEPIPCSTVKPEYANYTDYDVIVINSVGEGLINVCGEGGDIEIGDLIVTSSIAGKGMKQSDDIVRNITVAKSRENVTFTSPDEIKQIACIYMCG